MNPFQIVKDFEEAVAEYAGCKHAVAVDCCTNALFLCCKYLKVEKVSIPKETYMSVPCSIIHSGGSVEFRDEKWKGLYQLKPYPIYDAAAMFSRNMYVYDSLFCISFSSNKNINIGKGGMILTNDSKAVEWFKLARYMAVSYTHLTLPTTPYV